LSSRSNPIAPPQTIASSNFAAIKIGGGK